MHEHASVISLAVDTHRHEKAPSLDSGGIAPLPFLELGMQQGIFILCRVRPGLELSEGALKVIRFHSNLQDVLAPKQSNYILIGSKFSAGPIQPSTASAGYS